MAGRKGGWVYIMTNMPNGTLYTGVTADLAARATQHREGKGSDFCRQHGLTRLVWFERHDDIYTAITRVKAIKKWRRHWKLRLIHQANPEWRDLYEDLIYLL